MECASRFPACEHSHRASNFSQPGSRFSLSLGERAGVRGKEMQSVTKVLYLRGAEVIELGWRPGGFHVPFPLTLSLSLGERGTDFPAPAQRNGAGAFPLRRNRPGNNGVALRLPPHPIG
jgi:hypothetical protein